MTRSRYMIGIDLGTTTCVVSYLDTLEENPQVRTLELSQWAEFESLTKNTLLPSFCYIAPKAQWKKGQLNLPWKKDEEPLPYAVGVMAKAQMNRTPERVVHSAKSWLCHGGVQREERFLPWQSESLTDDEKMSPVEVSSKFLSHIKDVWNQTMALHEDSYALEHQQIIVTVPASFDESASQLTYKACELAGFQRDRLGLVEEPQAAFYHWLYSHGGKKEALLALKSLLGANSGRILVCDVGGGTTDFSLFEFDCTKDLQLKRIAVSQHILLGGDNIDMSLARLLETRLLRDENKKLMSSAWETLVASCREIKEKALDENMRDGEEKLFVSIAQRNTSSLFASTLSADITVREVREHVLNTFFPSVQAGEKPAEKPASAKEWGLPYAYDHGVTRHLSEFLEGKQVDAVLWAGGTLIPKSLRQSLLETMTQWQNYSPKTLEMDSLVLAISCGASWFAYSQAFDQKPIEAGYPRSLYLLLQDERHHTQKKLLCILPKGHDSREPVSITDLEIKALVGKPVLFQMFYSVTREDKVGALLNFEQDRFFALPPLEACLDIQERESFGQKVQSKVPVSIEVVLGDTGLLDIYCVGLLESGQTKKWKLHFNVRELLKSTDSYIEQPKTEGSATIASDILARIESCFSPYFGKPKKDEEVFEKREKVSGLIREIEEVFRKEKTLWSLVEIRALYEMFFSGEKRRSRSLKHELVWFNILGFLLRPGFGHPGDSERMKEVWSLFQRGLFHAKEKSVQSQWWIFWRRVAGGLSAEQQEVIFNKIFPALKNSSETPELIMLAGALERIPMQKKNWLGQFLVEGILTGRVCIEQKLWALSRIASRSPMYAEVHHIIRPSFVEEWGKDLESFALRYPAYRKSCALFYSQGGRMLGDRHLDISYEARIRFLEVLTDLGAREEQKALVQDVVSIDRSDKEALFGESLPIGLMY